MGGLGPAHDAGRDDVRARNDRDGGRGDQDRRVRLPREAGRAAEAPRHRRACAQDDACEGAAARLARGARRERRGARRRTRDRTADRGEEARCCSSASPAPATSPQRARCSSPTRRGSRSPSGARLSANPLAVLDEAREGTLYCAEIGQYAKAEQKGLAFLLPKLERASVTLVCTSAEPLGNLAAEGRFDPALLAALSIGAVLLPPLRSRREDIPRACRALLARHHCRAEGRRARSGPCGRAAGRRGDGARQRVLAGQRRSPAERRREPRAQCRYRRDHAGPREAPARRGRRGQSGRRSRNHRALLRAAAARGARGVRAHLLRAAPGPRAEQHEPRRRQGGSRAHAPLPQAEAAQHPLRAPRRRPRGPDGAAGGDRDGRHALARAAASAWRRSSSVRSASSTATSAPRRSTRCGSASRARTSSRSRPRTCSASCRSSSGRS